VSASRRGGTTWSPDLFSAVALIYVIVGIVFFGAGYLIGRIVL
jgi:hypothetical protein